MLILLSRVFEQICRHICAMSGKVGFSIYWPVKSVSAKQSHYREVPRWEIFMEQELRFGLDLGRMAEFPSFIASKSFDLWNHHVSKKCFWYIWHILMYQKYIIFLRKHFKFFIGSETLFNCVLPHWRHPTAGLLYNDFAHSCWFSYY